MSLSCSGKFNVPKKLKGKNNKRRRKKPSKSQQQIIQTTSSSRMTLLLTILGLVIGAISLITLIELFPRLSASYEPPFDITNAVPAFSIKNEGYFAVNSVEPACFIWKLKSQTGLSFERAWSQGNRDMGIVDSLSPTQTTTISCGIGWQMPATTIQEFDLAVIVYFRPWPLTFIRQKKVFRFVAHQGKDGLIFHKQPPEPLEKDIEKAEAELKKLRSQQH
jgi:hypothetical protein